MALFCEAGFPHQHLSKAADFVAAARLLVDSGQPGMALASLYRGAYHTAYAFLALHEAAPSSYPPSAEELATAWEQHFGDEGRIGGFDSCLSSLSRAREQAEEAAVSDLTAKDIAFVVEMAGIYLPNILDRFRGPGPAELAALIVRQELAAFEATFAVNSRRGTSLSGPNE